MNENGIGGNDSNNNNNWYKIYKNNTSSFENKKL